MLKNHLLDSLMLLKSLNDLERVQILEQLATRIPLFIPQKQPALINAAVLVPIMLQGSSPTILLTKRMPDLLHHAGQVSFPGGKCHQGENAVDCALRESEEEIGLLAKHVEIITTLGSWPSYSGFNISPVIGLISEKVNLTPQASEVAEIFEIPLEVSLDISQFNRVDKRLPAPHHYFELQFKQKRIWGFTAGLLLLLAHIAKRDLYS